jgi:hypothetical protein
VDVESIQGGKTRVLRWDPYLEPDENDMEFHLTYEGALFAHQDDKKILQRNEHVHSIRRQFHEQLKVLWHSHPILNALRTASDEYCNKPNGPKLREIFDEQAFNWLPIVTTANELICKVDILMLRHGPPGEVPTDIDNRIKTLFDALRKTTGPSEQVTKSGRPLTPTKTEDPFYVLLQDDKLITHVSVTSDMLLEPVRKSFIARDNAVRLVINVTVRPYHPFAETVGFA